MKKWYEALGFASLSLLATWPLARHLTTYVPGSNVWNSRVIYSESASNLWNLWWFQFALTELRQSPFDCTYVFYPYGANLWFHTLSPLPAALGTLLQPILGLVATQNGLVLASFVIAGMSAAALARHVGVQGGAAMLAGALYAFSPAVLAHLYAAHFELMWTFWMPAVLLAFLRLLDPERRSGWWQAVGLGVLVVAAAYTTAYYAVYSMELIAVAAVVRWRFVLRRESLQRLVVAALIAIVGVMPLAIRFSKAEANLPTIASIRRDFRDFSIEPAGLLVPSFMHPVLSTWLRPLHTEMNRGRAVPQETTGYLGLTAIALAVTAIVGRRRKQDVPGRSKTIEWQLMTVIATSFVVLSLGAELKYRGRPTGLTLPAAALAEVPVLHQARAPGRHIVVAMLGIAVLAGAGWQNVARRRWRSMLVLALMFEYWPSVPLTATTVPNVYQRLAREPGAFAVLEVPFGVRDGTRVLGQPDVAQLLAQTVHHKPILSGMVSRLPDGRWEAVTSAPLVASLLNPSHAAAEGPPDAVAYFAQWNIRAIVIHPHASDTERRLIATSLPIRRREAFPDGIELWWLE